MIPATVTGIVILMIITALAGLLLPSILNVINPAPPLCDEQPVPGCISGGSFGVFPPNAFHNWIEGFISFVCLYFLSVSIISFFVGFSLKNWTSIGTTLAQESFLSSFIIGALGPFLLFGWLLPQSSPVVWRQNFVIWIVSTLVLGLFGGFFGILGLARFVLK